MIPAYPPALPLAQRDGYAFKPTNNITRTEMQSGWARQRIEFENPPDKLRLKFRFSEGEARLFDLWVKKVVGAGWFTMRIVTPMGFDDVKIRFTEKPDGPVLVGRYSWDYSAEVEVEDRPTLDEDWLLLPDFVTGSDIFDLAINREWPKV